MPSWSTEINIYLRQVKSTHDDDGIDRLNYVTTIYMLLAFALTIFAKNYVGEPLQCWVPSQWKDAWEDFAESYCFIENTYFVPMNQTTLPEEQKRESMEMIYYQWVPFILSLMAFFFYLPRAAWRALSSYSGLALSDMVTSARKSAKLLDEKQKKAFKNFAATLENRIGHCNSSTLRYGKSLFNIYIVMKILIWLNLLLQFYFLNHFLGTGYVLWGFGILIDMINGRHWQTSGHFPRVAFCDLTVREMGNVNNWTVQCVLMVNMFNEKIFIFIWWWLAFVLLFTTGNLVLWLANRFSPSRRISFLSMMRKESRLDGGADDDDRFYREVLKDDGVLVLRLLDANAGRIQSTELYKQLWQYGQTSRKGSRSTEETDDITEDTQLLNEKTGAPTATP